MTDNPAGRRELRITSIPHQVDATTAVSQSEPRAEEPDFWAAVRAALPYCVKVFLVVRVGLALLTLAVIAVVPFNEGAGAVATPAGWQNLWTAWQQWDAGWFLQIASDGYTVGGGSTAFFPLYPLFIRAVTILTGGHALAAALLISHLAFLAGIVIVYLMTDREWGERMARRTVLYLSIFPTALFFFAPYSESLFLLLSASCLYAARRGNFGVAAVAGALASATRSIGAVLALSILIEVIGRARRAGERKVSEIVWGVACSAFALVGVLLYSLYLYRKSGDWLLSLHEQVSWQRGFQLPFRSILDATRQAFGPVGVDFGGYHVLDWLIVVPLLICGVWVVERTAATYSVFTWLSLLVPLSFVFAGRPLMSTSRFMIVIVPLFWALAYAGDRWKMHEVIVGLSAGGLAVMTLLFLNGYWVF